MEKEQQKKSGEKKKEETNEPYQPCYGYCKRGKKKNSQRRQKHTSARLTGRSFSFFFFCSDFLFVLCAIAVLSRLDVQLSVDVLFSLHLSMLLTHPRPGGKISAYSLRSPQSSLNFLPFSLLFVGTSEKTHFLNFFLFFFLLLLFLGGCPYNWPLADTRTGLEVAPFWLPTASIAFTTS